MEHIIIIPENAIKEIHNPAELGLYAITAYTLARVKSIPILSVGSIRDIVKKNCFSGFEKSWKALGEHGWLKTICLHTDNRTVLWYELRSEPDLVTPEIQHLSSSASQDYIENLQSKSGW